MSTRRIPVTLTTSAGGAAAVTVRASGELLGFAYDGGLDNSADITITDETTGAVIALDTAGLGAGAAGSARLVVGTASITTSQGIARVGAAGTALTAVDANSFNAPPLLFGDTSITVANGGNALTGILVLLVRS